MLVGPDGPPATYREFVRQRYPRSRQVKETCALIDELLQAAPLDEVPSSGPSSPVISDGETGAGLSRTYPEKWYRDRAMYRPAYHEFARAIEEAFAPESLVDLGCGAGYLVEYFAGKIPVLGVEGSEAAFRVMSEKARGCAVPGDLTHPPPERVGEFEFAVSIEVAEHVAEEHARDFARWFEQADRVLLTAAPPGQGGNEHVNEQPPEYWHRLLGEMGFRYCPEATARWRALARAGTRECRWVVQNAMFFRKD
jgi:SAM-dependent methyltransferase